MPSPVVVRESGQREADSGDGAGLLGGGVLISGKATQKLPELGDAEEYAQGMLRRADDLVDGPPRMKAR